MKDNRSSHFAFFIFITFAIVILQIYLYNFYFFDKLGYGYSGILKIKNSGDLAFIFGNIYTAKITPIIIIAIGLFFKQNKRKVDSSPNNLYYLIIALVIYFFSNFLYKIAINETIFYFVIGLTFLSFLISVSKLSDLISNYRSSSSKDPFDKNKKSFPQVKEYINTDDSFNFQHSDGWVNVVNPYRANLVLGTPGSGKTYIFFLQGIYQAIEKGYSIYLYDYKNPELINFTLNCLDAIGDKAYIKKPKINIIDFDKGLTRVNSIAPHMITDFIDAMDSASSLLLGMNPDWASKKSEFFVMSPINFLAMIIWGLRIYEDGKYCSLPHAIELASKDYQKIFKFLSEIDDPDVSRNLKPYEGAMENETFGQLDGQIGTLRLFLNSIASEKTYYTLTTSDDERENKGCSLFINDAENPQLFFTANNEKRRNVYGPLISMINSRIYKEINVQNVALNKLAMFIDEYATTISPPGTIDNLIATARSKRSSVWLGLQDIEQATRDMKKENATALISTIGNIYSGAVNFDTAEKLSKQFGQINIKSESTSLKEGNITVSEKKVSLITPDEFSMMSTGTFAVKISDSFDNIIEEKRSLGRFDVPKKIARLNSKKRTEETTSANEIDIKNNYVRIINDVIDMVDQYF